MKKLITLFVFCGIQMFAFGQNRLVLVEEFTNTGCNPCAAWSPELDSVINYRLGDCIAIKYHFNYPNREDKLYHYQPDVQQARADFYHVDGVPANFTPYYNIENDNLRLYVAAIEEHIVADKPYNGVHLDKKQCGVNIVNANKVVVKFFHKECGGRSSLPAPHSSISHSPSSFNV